MQSAEALAAEKRQITVRAVEALARSSSVEPSIETISVRLNDLIMGSPQADPQHTINCKLPDLIASKPCKLIMEGNNNDTITYHFGPAPSNIDQSEEQHQASIDQRPFTQQTPLIQQKQKPQQTLEKQQQVLQNQQEPPQHQQDPPQQQRRSYNRVELESLRYSEEPSSGSTLDALAQGFSPSNLDLLGASDGIQTHGRSRRRSGGQRKQSVNLTDVRNILLSISHGSPPALNHLHSDTASSNVISTSSDLPPSTSPIPTTRSSTPQPSSLYPIYQPSAHPTPTSPPEVPQSQTIRSWVTPPLQHLPSTSASPRSSLIKATSLSPNLSTNASPRMISPKSTIAPPSATSKVPLVHHPTYTRLSKTSFYQPPPRTLIRILSPGGIPTLPIRRRQPIPCTYPSNTTHRTTETSPSPPLSPYHSSTDASDNGYLRQDAQLRSASKNHFF